MVGPYGARRWRTNRAFTGEKPPLRAPMPWAYFIVSSRTSKAVAGLVYFASGVTYPFSRTLSKKPGIHLAYVAQCPPERDAATERLFSLIEWLGKRWASQA